MDITPDTKDWTWVLQRTCPECGFDTRQVRREKIPAMVRNCAVRFDTVLEREDDALVRPSPDVWSPLEYACHVRDVFRLYDERLQRMLTEDAPAFENWDQDAAAVLDRYGDQIPAVVSTELRVAADRIARSFEGVTDTQWQRTGTRSDGAHFTVETFARYFIHDPIHHVYDITGESWR